MSESSIRTAQAEEQARILDGMAEWLNPPILVEAQAESLAALKAGAAALRARTDAWQPIETAPKDGTKVLVYQDQHGFQGMGTATYRRFDDGGEGWIGSTFHAYGVSGWTTIMRPSHWMPLHSPPSPDQDEQKK